MSLPSIYPKDQLTLTTVPQEITPVCFKCFYYNIAKFETFSCTSNNIALIARDCVAAKEQIVQQSGFVSKLEYARYVEGYDAKDTDTETIDLAEFFGGKKTDPKTWCYVKNIALVG